MDPGIEKVTKLDAARRQLTTAITLFFNRGDSVSVHTLAAAAREVVADLARLKGIAGLFRDNPIIRPDKQAEVRRIFGATENFFKHAYRDPDEVHDFRPAVTPFHIFDALTLYGLVGGNSFPEGDLFKIWFYVKFPNVTLGDLRVLVDQAHRQGIVPDDFETVKLALAKWKEERGGV